MLRRGEGDVDGAAVALASLGDEALVDICAERKGSGCAEYGYRNVRCLAYRRDGTWMARLGCCSRE